MSRTRTLDKILRLKNLRTEIAEREYQRALNRLHAAEAARDNAAAVLDDRRINAKAERRENLQRIFSDDFDNTPINHNRAVQAYLRSSADIQLARRAVDAAEQAVEMTADEAEDRRQIYAERQRNARKIDLMRKTLIEEDLRRS